jgi:hypothetical protein
MVVKKRKCGTGVDGGASYMTAVAGWMLVCLVAVWVKRVQVDLGYQCVLCVCGGGVVEVYVWGNVSAHV